MQNCFVHHLISTKLHCALPKCMSVQNYIVNLDLHVRCRPQKLTCGNNLKWDLMWLLGPQRHRPSAGSALFIWCMVGVHPPQRAILYNLALFLGFEWLFGLSALCILLLFIYVYMCNNVLHNIQVTL